MVATQGFVASDSWSMAELERGAVGFVWKDVGNSFMRQFTTSTKTRHDDEQEPKSEGERVSEVSARFIGAKISNSEGAAKAGAR